MKYKPKLPSNETGRSSAIDTAFELAPEAAPAYCEHRKITDLQPLRAFLSLSG